MKRRLLPCLSLVLVLLFSTGTQAAPTYVGTWGLKARFVNNQPETPVRVKTLVLHQAVFSAVTAAPPAKACSLSGAMTATAASFKVQVAVSGCPAPETTGAQVVYSYTLGPDGSELTLGFTGPSGPIREVYDRLTPVQSGSATCGHPFCGVWNRTATYVAAELMHNEPAHTVITEKDYYSIAAACFNKCSMDQVTGDPAAGYQVTMTMRAHNCPVGPVDPTPPGTVITANWKVSADGQMLTIVDTRYGTPVTTEFRRIQ
jgi:hypothetical protein